MKRLAYLLPVLFLLWSCDMQIEPVQEDDTIVIPAGNHASTHPFKGFSNNKITFDAKFLDCSKYTCMDPENQADINKLMGFSSCSSHHHQNSARVGWRWYNNQLEIFAYIYDQGQRKEEFLTTVDVNKYNHYEIIDNDEGYLFKVNEFEKQINTETNCSSNANYVLWPYFGGDEVAPHDIHFKVDILEGID